MRNGTAKSREKLAMKLPTQEELQALRAGLRKRKVPRVFDGMWCSEPGIGGVKLTAAGADFHVEWVRIVGGVESPPQRAQWSSLCSDPSLEMQRLEIGLMVAEVLKMQGQRIMDAIGHPIDAFNEVKPYREASEAWEHWGIVKAGHMLGLTSGGTRS
jgi:hypothetical protein